MKILIGRRSWERMGSPSSLLRSGKFVWDDWGAQGGVMKGGTRVPSSSQSNERDGEEQQKRPGGLTGAWLCLTGGRPSLRTFQFALAV